jgi:hypothetical protein
MCSSHKFSIFVCVLIYLNLLTTFAQGVGINTDGSSPDGSALLDIKATDKGILLPRISLIDVTNPSPVASPAIGLLIYNTNPTVTGGSGTGFYYWNGSQWVKLDIIGANWQILGNGGTNSTIHFLGTTDAQPLNIRVNNQETFRFNIPSATAPGWSIHRGGGNTRGLHAVDLQSSRNIAQQVASGDYSVIAGGQSNWSSGHYSAIGGGQLNQTTGNFSTVAGGYGNYASGLYTSIGGGYANLANNNSVVGGGSANYATGMLCAILGGSVNVVTGSGSFIGAGNNNSVSGSDAALVGGMNNQVIGNNGFIGSGLANTVYSPFGFLGGGSDNIVNGFNSVIVGGTLNTTNGFYSTVVGGSQNIADNNYTFVGGGSNNEANGEYAVVGGGSNNLASGISSVIGGGDENEASGNYSSVFGGSQNSSFGAFSIVGGGDNNSVSGEYAAVVGGQNNSITDNYSSILGGSNLILGARSVGFSGQTSLTPTNLSSHSQIAAFVDVNFWLYNVDNTARQLRFYEPSGSGTNFSAFRAQPQGSDIIYTLPANLLSGGLLQTDGSGNLSWVGASGLNNHAWTLIGNSGTNPSSHFIGTTDAQPLAIRTNNIQRIFITSGGDVGVGTSSPSHRLHSSGAVRAEDGFLANDGTAGIPAYRFHADTDVGMFRPAANQIGFSMNGVEKIRFNGNATDALVGINTLSPSAPIEFNRTTDNSMIVGTNYGNAPNYDLRRAQGTISAPSLIGANGVLARLRALGYDGSIFQTAAQVAFEVDAPSGSNDMPGRITFSTTPDGSSSLVERMRITNAGNVGINHINPQERLHVVDNIYATGALVSQGISVMEISFSENSNLGGPDNAYHQVTCPDGYAMINLGIYASSALDGGERINCVKVNDLITNTHQWRGRSGNPSTPGTHTNTFANGDDNQAHSCSCNSGEIATGIEIYSTDRLDGGLKIRCTQIKTGYSLANDITTTINGHTVRGISTSMNIPWNVNRDDQYHVSECPPGTFVTGVVIQATGRLDGEMRCFCSGIKRN